ncbi:MAG: hypothetical protein AAF348_13225 [Bacteroidota bacterium]
MKTNQSPLKSIPLRLIAEIDLANEPAPAPTSTVWLDDGTILAAEPAAAIASPPDTTTNQIAANSTAVSLTLGLDRADDAGNAVAVVLSDLMAITHGPLALHPLRAFGYAMHSAELERRGPLAGRVMLASGDDATFPFAPGNTGTEARPAVFGATVRLSAPPPGMTGRDALADPDSVRAVAAKIAHDNLGPGPRSSCIVVVTLTGDANTTLERVELTPEQPVAELRIALPPVAGGDAEIRVRVEPGPAGPIQDRVLIDGAVIAPGPPTSLPPSTG